MAVLLRQREISKGATPTVARLTETAGMAVVDLTPVSDAEALVRDAEELTDPVAAVVVAATSVSRGVVDSPI